jgi:hypothetical protein
LDVTGIDVLSCDPKVPGVVSMHLMGSEVPWYAARLASSVADLDGKPLVMSETSEFHQLFAKPPQQVPEGEFRATYNRVLLGGANRLNTYSPFHGLDDQQIERLNTWVGRCSRMLTGGHRVADIAVLYPIESAWLRFTPSEKGVLQASDSARQLALSFRAAGDALYAAQMEFDFIDSRAILESAVENGRLTHGPLRWRAVVLPCVDTLPLQAWQKLLEFHRNGGVIVAIGALPANSEKDFPCEEVRRISEEIFGKTGAAAPQSSGKGIFLNAGEEEARLAQALEPHVRRMLQVRQEGSNSQVSIPESFSLSPGERGRGEGDSADHSTNGTSPLRATHRRIDGHDVFFVINDSAEAWSGQVNLPAQRPGQQFDPASGHISPLPSAEQIPLRLDPYGAVFYRFPTAP